MNGSRSIFAYSGFRVEMPCRIMQRAASQGIRGVTTAAGTAVREVSPEFSIRCTGDIFFVPNSSYIYYIYNNYYAGSPFARSRPGCRRIIRPRLSGYHMHFRLGAVWDGSA